MLTMRPNLPFIMGRAAARVAAEAEGGLAPVTNATRVGAVGEAGVESGTACSKLLGRSARKQTRRGGAYLPPTSASGNQGVDSAVRVLARGHVGKGWDRAGRGRRGLGGL